MGGRLVDRVAAYFVQGVLLIAAGSFLGWLLLGHSGLTHALVSAVAVLVIACPCAMGLATPTAVMVGTGKGAELGILIKSAESLERVRQVTTVVFDKTGTLTQGRPSLTDVIPLNGSGQTTCCSSPPGSRPGLSIPSRRRSPLQAAPLRRPLKLSRPFRGAVSAV